jgi:trans-aconitate methyltransferase
MSRATHWNGIYGTKSDLDVSWFEPRPDVSLRLMDAAGVTPATRVIDIGGGDSRLVDALLARGLRDVTVLDVSGAALDRARARLGPAASIPTWIEADVTSDWKAAPVDIWHDRAVFHFLVDPHDRARYVERLREILEVGGTAIIATFAADGPTTCSGGAGARD